MSDATIPTRRELEERLVARAQADDGFRERLKADPRAVVSDEAGITVPESVTIEVLEETPEKGYLVIPVNRAELSDEELDAASGGGYADASPYGV
jgi:hypothetical protein